MDKWKASMVGTDMVENIDTYYYSSVRDECRLF
nr:MAG TPA: hypothetical protein [Caudoviricetes sp.]